MGGKFFGPTVMPLKWHGKSTSIGFHIRCDTNTETSSYSFMHKSDLCPYTLQDFLNMNIHFWSSWTLVSSIVLDQKCWLVVPFVFEDFERHSCNGDSWTGAVVFSFVSTTRINHDDVHIFALHVSCSCAVIWCLQTFVILIRWHRMCRY